MQLKKEMFIFYSLLIVSAGVIIAADQPQKNVLKKESIKCCCAPKAAPDAIPSASPLNIITEGLLRFKA
jgi:hypothetical protein